MIDQPVQRVMVSEEEWIVACLCTLCDTYARTDVLKQMGKDLRAERGLSRAGVLDYLARFEEHVRSVEPVLIPHLEHMLKYLAAARAAAGIDRPQAQA